MAKASTCGTAACERLPLRLAWVVIGGASLVLWAAIVGSIVYFAG